MDSEKIRKLASDAGVEWHEFFKDEGAVNLEILGRMLEAHKQELAEELAGYESELKGPSYGGVTVTTMLERLREQHGSLTMENTEDGWSVKTPLLTTKGKSVFQATMVAYREIKGLYAENDERIRDLIRNFKSSGFSEAGEV